MAGEERTVEQLMDSGAWSSVTQFRRLLEATVAQITQQLLFLVQRQRIVQPHQILDDMHGAIGNDDIQPTVVVIIDECRPEPSVRCGCRIKPDRVAAILELSIAEIDE